MDNPYRKNTFPETSKTSPVFNRIATIILLTCFCWVSSSLCFVYHQKLGIIGFLFTYIIGVKAGFNIKFNRLYFNEFVISPLWKYSWTHFCKCIFWPIYLPIHYTWKLITYIVKTLSDNIIKESTLKQSE